MLATRRGSLVFTALCALAALGILLFAMSQYQHTVAGNAKQDTVLVATSLIHKGSSADLIASEGLYRVTPVLVTQAEPGAIVDAGSLAGKVAASDILPGQQLTTADFIVGAVGTATQLAPDERAIAVSLDAAHSLGGVLKAGDQVDVYAGFTVALDATNTEHPLVRLLIPDATVLGAPAASAGVSAGGDVMLAVNSDQVATLAYATANGVIWLALRPPNATAPNTDLTTINTILLGARATAGGTLGAPRLVFKGTVNLAGGQ
jgi:pilus assembly protein CpaB